MTNCTNCGRELGVGRFCTNCGHPIDWRTDTAERPAVQPPLPPPPSGSRFPLFADEVPTTPPPVGPPVGPSVEPTPHRRRTGPWVTWLAVAVVLSLVAGLGLWLLIRSGDDDTTAASETPASSQEPSGQTSERPGPDLPPGELASRASVTVPDTAPANQDVSGNPVTFTGANMLDGVPETCWRMPGDGAGDQIVVTLPAETRLGSVGMVNGYAKSAQDAQGRELDWYDGNRRVLSVEWSFDDGSSIVQELDDTTELQSVDVDVTTTVITIRLVEVSAPGAGPAGRDYTAISELSLIGR